MKKRIAALFMTVILVCCLMPKTNARADDSDIAPQWNYKRQIQTRPPHEKPQLHWYSWGVINR